MTTSAPIPPAMLAAATKAILAKDGWTPDFPATPPSDVRENAEARADAALAAVGYGELVAALDGLECYARQIVSGLPHHRDWLDPDVEKNLKAYVTDACQLLARVHGEASEGKR